jgi:tetratricopeptide (TPR) repeat protein/serine phosphatase RsbU (regulator of sigma subunit)
MKKVQHVILISFLFLYSSLSFSQSDPVLDSLKYLLKAPINDTLKLRIRHQIGEHAMIFRVGYWDSIRIDAKRFGIKKTEGDALNNLGYIYQNLGDIKKALEYNKQSLILLIEIDDKPGIAQSYNNIGTIYNEQGDVSNALEYFHKSLKIHEETKDEIGIATSLNNLGSIYEDQGDTAKALEYFERSIKYYESVGDMEGLGYPLSNIGIIHFSRGKLALAREYYNKSLEARLKIGDKRGIAHCYNNIGAVYYKQGDVDSALQYYNKSYAIFNEIGDKQGISFIARNLGDCFRRQKQYSPALKHAETALSVSKEIGYTENINRAEELLSDIYRELGQFEKALTHYKQYIIYRDSTSNERTRKASIKKQLQYEFEKKEAAFKAEQAEKDIFSRAELKQQKLITWFSIAGGVLVFVMLILAFRGYRTKRKANHELSEKNHEIETQKHIVEEKNKEIVDSINYAQRIQHALLASEGMMNKNIPSHFVLFKPKDIVSGDFYWTAEKENYFYLAVCDSTGHGVPGAFMSLLNISFLNEAITERGIIQPNAIFNHVRKRLIESISMDGAKDGMDGILLCIDKKTNAVTYAAAHNSPLLICNGELKKLDCDKMPVGLGEKTDSFTLYSIAAKKGDTIYLSTDGYADQFGGDKGKKLKSKHLQEKLFSISDQQMNEQRSTLDNFIENWKGDLAQVDDICIIGIRL